MRKTTIAVTAFMAAIFMAAMTLAGTALAGSTTTSVTGPTASTYTFTVTCATRSASARVNMRPANHFAGFEIVDDAGTSSGFEITKNGVPTPVSGLNWTLATYLDSVGDSYELQEGSNGTGFEVIAGPTSTLDCPTYGSGGSAFTPLTPTRILDTRAESAVNYAGAKPGVNGSIELQVSGVGGVPDDAVAVALNVTATETTAPGFIQVFPTGLGSAGSSSNINAESAGQTIPNSVIAPLGTGGTVTLYTSAGTHLIADVAGYFVATSGMAQAGRYVGVAPKRVLDTRSASLVNYTGSKPAGGATVAVNPVVAAALPTGQVSAVAINVTAAEATAAGYVQVAPAGALVPGASSNLNLTAAGQTVPNLVIVPVSATGEIDLYSQNGTHLIVDVLGYFTNESAAVASSGLFVPVTPERILDTRPETAVNYQAARKDGVDTSKPAAGALITVYFDGLPLSTGPVVVNLTATEASAAGYVQGAAADALAPGASSNVNVERAGQTVANAAILPTSVEDAIDLYTQSGTNLIADISGFFRQ